MLKLSFIKKFFTGAKMKNSNKITLISVDNGWGHYGIRYLSSTLKKEKYNTNLIFLPHAEKYENETILKIIDICRDSIFIGISSMTVYKERAVNLKKILDCLNIPVLLGGLYPSLSPREAIEHFDYICVGEGEKMILSFAKAIQNNNFTEVENLWFKNSNNQISSNFSRTAIKNLDELEAPDYSGENHFLLENNRLIPLENDRIFHAPMFSFLTDRGCPFNCSYCHNNRIKKLTGFSNVRFHSVKYSIEFIKNILKQFDNIEYIWLQDDDFFYRSESEIIEFSELWKKYIKKPFFILGIPFNITEEKVSHLVNAGLFQIFVGIQTGSKKISKLYCRRYVDDSVIEKINHIAEKYKDRMMFKFDFIILNPFEDTEDIKDSINIIMKFKPPFYLSLNTLTFMPDTPLYRYALKKLKGFDSTGIIQDTIYYRFTRLKSFNSNKYLNLILCLMGQKNTKKIAGLLPVFMVKFLISDPVVNFFKNNSSITDKLVITIERIFIKYYQWRDKKYGADMQLPLDLINRQKLFF